MTGNYGRDIAAAAVLLFFGLSFAAYAIAYLQLGSFARMGPGMFPMLVGLVVAGLGTFQGVLTLRAMRANRATQDEPPEPIQWYSLVVVIAAMGLFAVVIRWFGLIPAIFTLSTVASFGHPRLTPALSFLIALVLSVLAWLIFVVALGLRFELVRWPF